MMIPCLCFLRMALTYIVPVRYCMNRGSANGAPAGGAFLVDIPSRWKPRTKQQPTGLLFATPAAWPCCSSPVPPTKTLQLLRVSEALLLGRVEPQTLLHNIDHDRSTTDL